MTFVRPNLRLSLNTFGFMPEQLKNQGKYRYAIVRPNAIMYAYKLLYPQLDTYVIVCIIFSFFRPKYRIDEFILFYCDDLTEKILKLFLLKIKLIFENSAK